MNDWRDAVFSDLCDITRGSSPRPIHDWLAPSGIPWVKIADATGARGRFIDGTRDFIKEDGKSRSREVFPGDLILSNSATPGIPKFMSIYACVHDGWMLLRNFRGLNKDYAYYLLLSERAALVSQGNGSVFNNLKTEILKKHRVRVPSYATQEKSASLLSALDDKIELNLRMGDSLEAIAQAILRDWFVDFGPVRRKLEGGTDPVAIMGGLVTDPEQAACLAALFPGVLADDGLPQGWGAATLSDLAIHCKGSVNPLTQPAVEFEHYSLPAFDNGQEPVIDLGASIKSNKTPVPAGAVLLSKLNPEIPRVWLPNLPTGRPQIASTEFLTFQPRPGVSRGLLYCLFRDPAVRQILAGMVTGTSKSHQRISPPALMKTTLLIGDTQAFGAFDQIVEPLLQRILSLRAENRTLAETRDYLLPRLMSGAVRVGEPAKQDAAA